MTTSTVFLILCSFLVAGIVGYGARRSLGQRKAWRRTAESRGLDYDRGGPLAPLMLTGSYRRRPVRLWQRSHIGDAGRVFYTVMETSLRGDVWEDLAISRYGVLETLTGQAGVDDGFAIGDDSFDEDFKIENVLSDEQEKMLASPEMRELLTRLSDEYFSLEIDGSRLTLDVPQWTSTRDELDALLDALTDHAEELETVADATTT